MLQLIGFALLALSFLMTGHYPPWQAFEQQVVAAFGGVLLATGVLVRRPQALIVPIPAAFIAALAVVPLIQHAFGLVEFRSDAVLSAGYLLAFAAAIIVGRAGADDRGRFIDALMGALLAAALASALIALVQWQQLKWSIFVVDLKPGERPYGNLAQPNHLATLLALGLVAVLRWYEQRRLGALASSALALYLGWALVMTQSRTGWVFVAMLVVWVLALRRRHAMRLHSGALAAGVVLFVLGVIAWGPLNDALLLSPPPELGHRLRPGLRWLHWTTLSDAAIRAPWFGYGWGQIALAQQAVIVDHAGSGEWLLESHNLLLDLCLYNGLPIGLLCAAAIVWWLARQVRACRSIDQWALLAATGAVLLHALLEYPLNYTYFLLPTGLMIGLLEAMGAQTQAGRLSRRLAALPLALLTGLLVWTSVEYVQVEAAIRQLRFVMAGIGVDKVSSAPEAEVWLLDQPRAAHRFWLTQVKPGMSAAELDTMKRSMMSEPRPMAMLRYAWAAGINGRPDDARIVLARMCKLHPGIRCDEGRASWATLALQFPTLLDVTYPETPPELRGTLPALGQEQ